MADVLKGAGNHEGQHFHILDGDLLIVRFDPETTLPAELAWTQQLVRGYAEQGINIQLLVLPKGQELERIPAEQARMLLEERLKGEPTLNNDYFMDIEIPEEG